MGELHKKGDLCMLCLALSQVASYEIDDYDYAYFSVSRCHDIYVVDKYTFPDAKYLPLTEGIVEYICCNTYIEEVMLCQTSGCGCDDLVIDASDTAENPWFADYGWQPYIVSGASGAFKQCNGTYLQ